MLGRRSRRRLIEHGRPAGMIELGGTVYVLRMFGAKPHEDADWHHCHLNPQE